MIWKIIAAVIVFVLVVAGFHYADPAHEISNIVVALVAFVGAALAYKYTPTDLF